MIKKTFEKVREDVYYEKLENGVEVYLYPTDKTKNFYLSISVKYGARINKYKINNKVYDIIPGSAHFLEHKVMALSENPEISKRINELGSLANAWTSYYGTNYNIFGSINLRENLKLLLDIFYNIDINEKCVNEEKGIIGEEIDMYKDQIDSYMSNKILSNLFHNSYIKKTVVGEREDIEKITAKSLNRIYKDYYGTNNTFIVVTGNFDKDIILEDIKEYMKNVKSNKKQLPKRIKKKDKETVCISYEEIKKDMRNDRVKCAFKIDKKRFNIKNDNLLRYYINIILSNNFSATSKLYEQYKNEEIIINMGSNVNIIDDYVIIGVSALTKDANIFINRIKEDILNISIDEISFERKKKLFLKSYILDFDNIEDVEYNISSSVMLENKVDFNEYSMIKDMKYSVAKDIINNLDFKNYSIIRTIK
ncbi:MAG: pitrilysin family protein [bacterium]|nr:pitrilysin family protein [bacterium]